MKVNQQQRYLINQQNLDEALLGCLLGDSSFERNFSVLNFQHSLINEDYIDFKYREFSRFLNAGKLAINQNKKCNLKDEIIERRGKIKRFRAYGKESFIPLKKLVVNKRGKRKIPKDLSLITPLVLFFWYLDDGTLVVRHPNENCATNNIRRSLRISLKSYTDKRILRLIKTLKKSYDLTFRAERNSEQKIIKICMESKKEIAKFLDIAINPFLEFVPKSMLHKINPQF